MGSSTSKPARTLGSKVSQAVSRATPSAPSTAKAAQSVAQEARQSPQRSSAARSNAAAAAHAAAGGSTHPDPQYAPSGHTKRDEDTRRQQRQSSEHKSADIMRDAFDPQFLENLSQIGQVKVPKNATNFSPTDQMLRILEARERGNVDNVDSVDHVSRSGSSAAPAPSSSAKRSASQSGRAGRISANTVTLLLDDRKHCETRADLERLAVEYDLPLQTITTLAKYYNSPTMGEEVPDGSDSGRASGEPNSSAQDFKGPPRVRGVWVEPQLRDAKIHSA